ncbi:zinc finger and BTB domain-containing protein 25 isoform X5 [Ictidomys tridecemlineatus]
MTRLPLLSPLPQLGPPILQAGRSAGAAARMQRPISPPHSCLATMDTASHSLVLLQQLNMQREFGFLCDCTVAIGDVYFKAHRAVLAAFSNYFKMIFIHQTSSPAKYCLPSIEMIESTDTELNGYEELPTYYH